MRLSLALRSATLLLGTLLLPDATAAEGGAMQRYEAIQTLRREASAELKSGTDKEHLNVAAAKLESALKMLDETQTKELARGSEYLYFRGHDVRLDLARVYCLLGEPAKALTALEQMQMYAWIPMIGDMIEKDSAFDVIRGDPRYKSFLAKAKAPSGLWKPSTATSAFKAELSAEERVAGLSLYWMEVRNSFAYFDKAEGLDWEKVYMTYLSKVLAVSSTRDYYEVLMTLAPLLRDSHTNIYPPKELTETFFARPPIQTARIGDNVVVLEVRSKSLAQRIKIGDEIVEIDGLPVDAYAAKRVEPYVSSSTPQDKMVRMYSYQLLSGDAKNPVKLRLRDGGGASRLESVDRTGYQDIEQRPQFAFKMLSDDVAYLAVDHFESDAGVKALQAAQPQWSKAKALILDLRNNGGGSTSHGLAILSYLTKEPIYNAYSYQREALPLDRARGEGVIRWKSSLDNGKPYSRKRDTIFEGKVVVLTGPKTFSAAEDFVVAFKMMKRGLIVGEATGGSTGQPLYLDLPGGGRGRICIKRDVFPDGSEFVGYGISPDIVVSPTSLDVRKHLDPVLERALAAVRG